MHWRYVYFSMFQTCVYVFFCLYFVVVIFFKLHIYLVFLTILMDKKPLYYIKLFCILIIVYVLMRNIKTRGGHNRGRRMTEQQGTVRFNLLLHVAKSTMQCSKCRMSVTMEVNNIKRSATHTLIKILKMQ